MTDDVELVSSLLVKKCFFGGKNIVYFEKGVSMLPIIKPGSKVFIKPLDENCKRQLKLGDIIFFFPRTNNKRHILHRIIKIKKLGSEIKIITRGDSKTLEDGYITNQNILGKVRKIEHEGDIRYLNKSYIRSLLLALSIRSNLHLRIYNMNPNMHSNKVFKKLLTLFKKNYFTLIYGKDFL